MRRPTLAEAGLVASLLLVAVLPSWPAAVALLAFAALYGGGRAADLAADLWRASRPVKVEPPVLPGAAELAAKVDALEVRVQDLALAKLRGVR